MDSKLTLQYLPSTIGQCVIAAHAQKSQREKLRVSPVAYLVGAAHDTVARCSLGRLYLDLCGRDSYAAFRRRRAESRAASCFFSSNERSTVEQRVLLHLKFAIYPERMMPGVQQSIVSI